MQTLNRIAIQRWLLIIVISLMTILPAYAQSDEINASNILSFVDAAYNNGDVSVIGTLYADDFMYHPGGFDRNFLLINILSLRAAIPDLKVTPIIAVSDSNWVALHMYIEGTFTNEMIIPDSVPIAPTNQAIQFVTNNVFHLNENGQVFEQWVTFDNLNYMSQLEMINLDPVAWSGSVEPLAPTIVSTEEQEITAISYYDAINRKDPQMLDQLLDTTLTTYNPFGTFDKIGQINDLSSLFGALPDLQITITQVISQGEYSAILYNMHGTFTSDFVTGDSAFPANNGELDLTRIDFLRFNESGNIVSVWEIYDSLDFMVQIGLLPAEMQQP